MHFIVGLGNPGEEYALTRHNVGRMALERLHKTHDFSLWKNSKKPAFDSSLGSLQGKKVTLVMPNTFMNKSGHAVAHFVRAKKDVGKLVVIHDDLDLPLGTLKISHGRSSGGHNGVESIIKAIKSKDFVRIRVGVSPKNTQGVAQKPKGEERVVKFILGKFSAPETKILEKILKQTSEVLELIATEGHVAAMNKFN